MRLLIVTQAVDENDLFLGFFTRWIAEFASRFPSVYAVCLKEGAYSLPSNVHVHSLGKESGRSRLKYVVRFFSYVWRLRNEYDAVFVHMNQEYVLLGGLLWKLLGKKVYLWRNHYAGNFLTDIAVLMSDGVFCTSKYSYTAKFKKTKLMPVGVDTETFEPISGVERTPCSLLFFARFAPSKRPDVLLDALKMLRADGVAFTASFYGSALPKDETYRKEIIARANELGDLVRFHDGVPNTEAPRIFSAHDIYADLSASGMYNKMMFEAAACGCLVLAASKDLAEQTEARFVISEDTAQAVAEKLKVLLSLDEEEQKEARAMFANIVKENSLRKLGELLSVEISV